MANCMRFAPSKEELLLDILASKITFDINICSKAVKEHSSHFLDPRTVDWSPTVNLFNNERYYLIKRVPKSQSGQNVTRTGETGYWKGSLTKKIKDTNDDVIGLMNHLNFYAFEPKTNDGVTGVKTRWYMHEYIFHTTTFQEWSVCRVKDSTAPEVAPLPPAQPAPPIFQIHHDGPREQQVIVDEPQEQQLAKEVSFKIERSSVGENVFFDNELQEQRVIKEEFFQNSCSFSEVVSLDANILSDFKPVLEHNVEGDDPALQSPRRKRPQP